MHFYERQMIDDFVQLGENSLQLCQKNGRFRDDHFGSFIRTHVQNALDFFHTAEVLITAELQSLASPSSPRESTQIQRSRLSSLRERQVAAIAKLLRQFLLYCVNPGSFCQLGFPR